MSSMGEDMGSKTQAQEPGDGEAQAARALIDLRTAHEEECATGICEPLTQLLAATDPRTLEELRQLEPAFELLAGFFTRVRLLVPILPSPAHLHLLNASQSAARAGARGNKRVGRRGRQGTARCTLARDDVAIPEGRDGHHQLREARCWCVRLCEQSLRCIRVHAVRMLCLFRNASLLYSIPYAARRLSATAHSAGSGATRAGAPVHRTQSNTYCSNRTAPVHRLKSWSEYSAFLFIGTSR